MALSHIRNNPTAYGYTGRKMDGYGDCWYCNETVVDPYIFAIPDPDSSRPLRVAVCRKRRCREAADSGEFSL